MTVSWLVAAAPPDDPASEVLWMAGALGASIVALVLGVRCWRGNEFAAVVEHERTRGPWPGGTPGSIRQYRSLLGASYLNTLGGAGFGVLGAGDLVRLAAGRGRDWGPWVAAEATGIVLLGIAVLLIQVYLFFGLPDRLRPPCQRGWEEIGGRLVLARPGATQGERDERKPIEVDPEYRDLVVRRRERRVARRRDPWATYE